MCCTTHTISAQLELLTLEDRTGRPFGVNMDGPPPHTHFLFKWCSPSYRNALSSVILSLLASLFRVSELQMCANSIKSRFLMTQKNPSCSKHFSSKVRF